MIRYLLILWCFIPGSLLAVQGDVELKIEEQSEYWMSQKVTAKLIVKTDAFAINDLNVNTQAEGDFIIVEPKSAAYKTTETIDDTQWQYTVYEYQIYPLRAGQLVLKPFQVQFSASMGYGQPKQAFNLNTQPLTFKVNQPEGLEPGQFALATSIMTVEVQYQPDIDRLKVGEAFERTIRISVQDVPDILLPTLPLVELSPTFRVYRSEPVLSQQKVDGSLVASRIEKENFVASNEAEITLPELAFYWFDINTQQIHKETVAAKSITVLPNPLLKNKNLKTEIVSTTEQITGTSLWYLLPLISMVFIVLYHWYYRHKALNHSDIAFKEFKKACFKGNASLVYQSFYQWAGSTLSDTRPLLFKTIYQDYPNLKSSLICLENSQVNESSGCDFKAMLKEVSIIHKQITIKQESKNNDLLLTLNPR